MKLANAKASWELTLRKDLRRCRLSVNDVVLVRWFKTLLKEHGALWLYILSFTNQPSYPLRPVAEPRLAVKAPTGAILEWMHLALGHQCTRHNPDGIVDNLEHECDLWHPYNSSVLISFFSFLFQLLWAASRKNYQSTRMSKSPMWSHEMLALHDAIPCFYILNSDHFSPPGKKCQV